MRDVVLTFFLTCFLLSCDKVDPAPEDYSGKSIDVNLIGAWSRTYSGRDSNNGITIYSDTIRFTLDNLGTRTTFRFSEVFNLFAFQFYTQNNIILFRPEGMEGASRLNYHIQNDSLFIPQFGIPYLKSSVP